jgi:hypothetical protein
MAPLRTAPHGTHAPCASWCRDRRRDHRRRTLGRTLCRMVINTRCMARCMRVVARAAGEGVRCSSTTPMPAAAPPRCAGPRRVLASARCQLRTLSSAPMTQRWTTAWASTAPRHRRMLECATSHRYTALCCTRSSLPRCMGIHPPCRCSVASCIWMLGCTSSSAVEIYLFIRSTAADFVCARSSIGIFARPRLWRRGARTAAGTSDGRCSGCPWASQGRTYLYARQATVVRCDRYSVHEIVGVGVPS